VIDAEPGLDPRVARTRAAVIEATLDLLAEVGYAGISIDAISKRCGVARTTIYRHWPTLAQIVQDAVSTTVDTRPAPRTGDVRADLRAHIDLLVAKLDNSWGRMLPVMIDAASRDPEILELQRRSTAERRAAAMQVVVDGVERGIIRGDVDLDLIGEMLVGPIFTRHLVRHDPITPEFLDDLLDVVWGIIAVD
jgi:AcrR family transcriptional regulator